MSWFKIWPKRWNGVRVFPHLSEKQLDKIDSWHHVYNIIWSDKHERYYIYQGYNLRNILWNHTKS